LPATPQDVMKLVENLQGRKVVAQQMHELAEAAGINTTPDDTGLGQTFMRWAWPFSEDEQPQSTDALLQEGFETGSTLDPWWWPFWSEKPVSEVTPEDEATTDVATEITEDTVESISAADTATTTEDATDETAPAATKTTKPAKQNWKWPF
ncbi:MAG: hypothetical protein ACI9A1_002053, partial [Lentimonas sp.]